MSDVDLEGRERHAEELAASLEGEAHQTRQARARALQEIEKLRSAEQAAIQRAEREEGEADRAASERAQAEQIAHDLAQDEATATERAGAERASAESAARRRAEAERIAQEHAEVERKARERAAEEQAAAEDAAQRRVAAERTLAEIAEGERTTSKRASELRELAQEATEQRHTAEASLDELRARERAVRARIAAERAAAAQMAAQRALSAQSALERAQAELAAAERAAAERAQLAHSIAERAAQAVAMADRAQRELGRAERSLADLEGGGDAQSGAGEEDAEADPDPDPDPNPAVAASATDAPEPVLSTPLAEPTDASEDDLEAPSEAPPPAKPVLVPHARPTTAKPGLRHGSRWRPMLLLPIGFGTGLGVLWALGMTGQRDVLSADFDPQAPLAGIETRQADAVTLPEAGLAATPVAEQTAPAVEAPAPVQTDNGTPSPLLEVAAPAAKPPRETLPSWIRNAVTSAPWDGRPMIALVLEGRGTPAPAAAVLNIATPLTLVYAADADFALAEARRARRAGYELLGVLPGAAGSTQRALDAELDTPELKQRLALNLERMDGFVGVRLPVTGSLARDVPRLQIVLRELARRGLLIVDTEGAGNAASVLARGLDTPFAVRDVELAPDASPEELGRQLANVERLAREQGSIIAAANTSTAVVNALERWLPTASSRGLRFVPLSAVVRHRTRPAR